VNIERHQQLANLRLKTEKAFRAKGAGFVDLLPPPRVTGVK
jgi:hypothetical protein